VTASLWIEATTRWDALALTRRLGRYRWFLVEPDAEHWDVHVAVGAADDPVPVELAECVRDWLDERGLDEATLHLAHREVVLSRH
jgi:hypothetical protein